MAAEEHTSSSFDSELPRLRKSAAFQATSHLWDVVWFLGAAFVAMLFALSTWDRAVEILAGPGTKWSGVPTAILSTASGTLIMLWMISNTTWGRRWFDKPMRRLRATQTRTKPDE